jgi:hypothetical protein
MNVAKVRKALLAALAAGIAAGVTAWPDGISTEEVGIIVAAVVVAGYGVFKIKNAPKEPTAPR